MHSSIVFSMVLSLGYQYYDQPIALEDCRKDNPEQLPNSLSKIVTPMKVSEWRNLLATYPDKRFASFFLRGIESGFRVVIWFS